MANDKLNKLIDDFINEVEKLRALEKLSVEQMNNWIYDNIHYCGECYSKLIIKNIKIKYN